jgi:hypothetical protein
LHHTAAMFVTSNLYTLLDHCIIDELSMSRLPCLEYLLNDMISIDVLSQVPHFVTQEPH